MTWKLQSLILRPIQLPQQHKIGEIRPSLQNGTDWNVMYLYTDFKVSVWYSNLTKDNVFMDNYPFNILLVYYVYLGLFCAPCMNYIAKGWIYG